MTSTPKRGFDYHLASKWERTIKQEWLRRNLLKAAPALAFSTTAGHSRCDAVETSAQFDFSVDEECDTIQVYRISMPIDQHDFTAFVASHAPGAIAAWQHLNVRFRKALNSPERPNVSGKRTSIFGERAIRAEPLALSVHVSTEGQPFSAVRPAPTS